MYDDARLQQLLENLGLECSSKERPEQPYATLLKEYQETRERLAEARLHIDRLRFGSHFTVNHVLLFKQDQSTRQDTPTPVHDHTSRVSSSCSLPRPALSASSVELEGAHFVDRTRVATGVVMEDKLLQYYPHTEELERQQVEERHLSHERTEHLGRVSELQEQDAGVNSDAIMNLRNASLDEVRSQVLFVQQQQQRLAGDISKLLQRGREGEDEMDERGRQLLQAEVSGGGGGGGGRECLQQT